MITLAWYLLKVIICSGILCGYYFLALRNKVFHRWNRFYLLAAIVISLIVPVMKINVFQNKEDKGTVVQMLQTISYGDEAVIEYSRNNGFEISSENVVEALYVLVSAILLTIFFLSLYKIKRLKKKYPETKIEDISFINTSAKGTPFSFFKFIFWNNAIDLHSRSGQQIFNHEIAHVKEKHSYDKIFLNLLLIFFWINPFFWLMRKELFMIHEFVADKEALEDSDINAFAEMILETVYPGQNFSIGNRFFYSPLKRRIMMLTKNKNPKVSYLSRLLVLPLATIVFFAFTLKVNSTNQINSYDGKIITVVIDAGHGGSDNGASANGLNEKDITLSIAKKIAGLNSDDHIKILLSRNNDQSVSVKDRVLFAKENNADLFISLHVNTAVNEQLNGFSVLIDKNNSEQNQLLASALIKELKTSYKTADKIAAREKGGVWVLDQNVCPSALVECGYLSNSTDAKFISNSADQEKVAQNIINAINAYASGKDTEDSKSTASIANTESNISVIKDTIPSQKDDKKVKGFTFNDAKNEVYVKYEDGSTETITEEQARSRGIILPPPANALYLKDGKIISKEEAKQIPSQTIAEINVLKGKDAIKKYGEKGKNGVIEITTKYKTGNVTYVETGADTIHGFPSDILVFIDGKESTKDEFKNIQPSNIESITILKGKDAILKYGEKAKNGSIEIFTKKASSLSPVKDTLPGKVFTKVEIEASFPGGLSAWSRYISKAIGDSISKFTASDYGTCVLRFIINVDGTVSDVVATTMKGTKLAEVSINAIKNGPKWIPASQNGHTVAAYRLQPVTLQNTDQKSNKEASTINSRNSTGKVFIKLDQPANFPGGQPAWLKYISPIVTQHGSELAANRNNSGTCEVRFLVDKNGKVSDVQPTTMKGTELADLAVNAIKDGPDWIPGKQSGHAVNSFVIQPVSFRLGDQSLDIKGTTKVVRLKNEQ